LGASLHGVAAGKPAATPWVVKTNHILSMVTEDDQTSCTPESPI